MAYDIDLHQPPAALLWLNTDRSVSPFFLGQKQLK